MDEQQKAIVQAGDHLKQAIAALDQANLHQIAAIACHASELLQRRCWPGGLSERDEEGS